MSDKKSNKVEEQVTDVKGTIVGFIAPDLEEKTQEQEIMEFKLKKQNEKQMAKLSEDEQEQKRKEYEKEEERLEGIKEELLKSIRERIPAIEKKFKMPETVVRKGKIVEKVKSKTQEKIEEKDAELQKEQNEGEKERE